MSSLLCMNQIQLSPWNHYFMDCIKSVTCSHREGRWYFWIAQREGSVESWVCSWGRGLGQILPSLVVGLVAPRTCCAISFGRDGRLFKKSSFRFSGLFYFDPFSYQEFFIYSVCQGLFKCATRSCSETRWGSWQIKKKWAISYSSLRVFWCSKAEATNHETRDVHASLRIQTAIDFESADGRDWSWCNVFLVITIFLLLYYHPADLWLFSSGIIITFMTIFLAVV